MASIPRDSIEKRVRAVLTDVLHKDISSFSLSSRIKEDLGADSLDTVTLLMALEEEFKSEIPDDTAKSLTTIEQVIDFIDKQCKETEVAP